MVNSPLNKKWSEGYHVSQNIERQKDFNFDRQRFENYTAFYDLQMRAEQKSQAHFYGRKPDKALYGFDLKPEVKLDSGKTKEIVTINERSMTSGTYLKRKIDNNFVLTDGLLEDMRTDPYHYPNNFFYRC